MTLVMVLTMYIVLYYRWNIAIYHWKNQIEIKSSCQKQNNKLLITYENYWSLELVKFIVLHDLHHAKHTLSFFLFPHKKLSHNLRVYASFSSHCNKVVHLSKYIILLTKATEVCYWHWAWEQTNIGCVFQGKCIS